MAEPLEAPSVQVTVAWELPPVAEVTVGAKGTCAVITDTELEPELAT